MLALNIRHLTPEFFQSTYPEKWVEIYTDRRYVLFDPVVTWARFSRGHTRWSEIPSGFFRGIGQQIFEHAALYGLKFGGVVSLQGAEGEQSLCVLSGARDDRELHDAELEEATDILAELIAEIGPNAGLSEVELEALRDLAEGLTHNEIAIRRKISPATVKKRLERARLTLGARNAVHAVAIATRRGLIMTDPMY